VTPLSLTLVAPVKPVPVSVTAVPTGPAVGENEARVGGDAVTVKVALLAAVPPEVVTDHVPLVAPPGTIAVICVAETTV